MGAVYRIGPSDFFTPGDLLADARTLNGQVNSLDDQNWDRPSQALFDGWTAFVSEWRAFYSDMGWFSALNNSNRDQLIQFENRFAAFAADYTKQSGQALPGGVIAPSTGSKDTIGDHLLNQLQPLIPSVGVGTVLLIVLAAVVLAFVWIRWGRKLITGGA